MTTCERIKLLALHYRVNLSEAVELAIYAAGDNISLIGDKRATSVMLSPEGARRLRDMSRRAGLPIQSVIELSVAAKYREMSRASERFAERPNGIE